MVQSSAGAGGVPRLRRRRLPQVSAVVVSVRLTPREAAALDARRGDRSRSDFLRDAALRP